MAGEKEKPLVIGKSARPRCFKGLDIWDLPVDWYSNKKVWMTREIMTQWLNNLDKMQLARRKIMLLDNATCHPNPELQNVRIIFLPANTTVACHPMDQGIISNFKVFYRHDPE